MTTRHLLPVAYTPPRVASAPQDAAIALDLGANPHAPMSAPPEWTREADDLGPWQDPPTGIY